MLTPTALRCEYKNDPMGIDKTQPRFDWRLTTEMPQFRGQKQSAYQIMVATSEANLLHDFGDLWNSGVVKSDQTTQIVYEGRPLTSEQHAYWKVRVWNAENMPSKWSVPAQFSIGLLQPEDWKAKWIGYDAPVTDESTPQPAPPELTLDGLKWIWSESKAPTTQATTKPATSQYAGDHPAPGSVPIGTRLFRTQIFIPRGEIARASALLTADQRFQLYVNGFSAGYGANAHEAWPENIAQYLHFGENVVGVWVRSERPGHFGVIGRFHVEMQDQTVLDFPIDDSWRAASGDITGWETMPAWDSDAWKKTEAVGAIGDEPWGAIKTRKLDLPPPPYLRKEFEVKKEIARAVLSVSALGLYEIHMNGARVGDELAPGWTDYSKRVHYQTYDVTAVMKSGNNAIGAILGDGWYGGYFGFHGKREWYGGKPRFIAQLKIEYTDGSSDTVVTDDSWKANYGPIREADLLHGCRYDANRELGEWDQAGFGDTDWQPVEVGTPASPKLQASPGPPVQMIERVNAKNVSERLPGVYIVDLGQNMVGWVQLKLPATRRGQKIQLRYAEMLDSAGSIYASSARSARATDTYISRGGKVNWEPKFTFHGFRYVEITGLDEAPPLEAVTGIVIHSRMKRTGEFECSDPQINQLVHNIIWGQKGNYIDIPTDCPQRDERLGWTGDAQFFIPTAAYNFDVAAFFNKWLVDLCEDSANDEGAFGSVAPEVIGSKGSFGATAWADAGIVCPYTVWRVYGDTRVIRDHYLAMAKYIEYLRKTSTNLVRTQGAYGDWLNLGGGAPSEVIGTAYFEHMTRLMSEMADAIGQTEDAEKFRTLADDIRKVFIQEFITDDGHIKDSSQTGYALAFAFNLIPQELRAQAADAFVEEIKKKDWHLATGFIGTPRLLPALSLAGKCDVAYRLLEQDTYPSWLYQVKLGATTMWERWDGYTPEKGFQDPGMNSFNHYAFGSVGEWLYRTVGGIDTDGPAYKHIIIRPQPDGKLTYARASYDSIRGQIESSWRIEGSQLTLEVSIPLNTDATIYIPTSDPGSVVEAKGAKPAKIEASFAVYKVGSGRYSFTANFTPSPR